MSDIFTKDGKVFVEGEEYDATLPIPEDDKDVFTGGEVENVLDAFVFETGGIDNKFAGATIIYDDQGVPINLIVGGYEYELIYK